MAECLRQSWGFKWIPTKSPAATQADLESVLQMGEGQVAANSIMALTGVQRKGILKKLGRLRLIVSIKHRNLVKYETHPLIREYFRSLLGSNASRWHSIMTDYYVSISPCNDNDAIVRDQQIVHHALRSEKYNTAIEASDRLMALAGQGMGGSGTMGFLRPYQVASMPLRGSSYREVYKKLSRDFSELCTISSRGIQIRSAYFDNQVIQFDTFREKLSKKSFPIRAKRFRLLPCAIELIRNSRFEPFTRRNPNTTFELLHRFAGITINGICFFVQLAENIKSGRKYFMSVLDITIQTNTE